MKHEPSAPHVQQRGLYWENQRMIHDVYDELKSLSELRVQALRKFRAQEEELVKRKNELLAERVRLNDKEDKPVSP